MNIIDKIKSIKDLTYTGGCSERQIKEAEDELKLKFPTEYREILKAFGCIDFGDTDLTELTVWTGLNTEVFNDVIELTHIEEQYAENFPDKHFVIGFRDIDALIVNEAGEVFDLTDGELDKICDSISDYLDMILKGSGYDT